MLCALIRTVIYRHLLFKVKYRSQKGNWFVTHLTFQTRIVFTVPWYARGFCQRNTRYGYGNNVTANILKETPMDDDWYGFYKYLKALSNSISTRSDI